MNTENPFIGNKSGIFPEYFTEILIVVSYIEWAKQGAFERFTELKRLPRILNLRKKEENFRDEPIQNDYPYASEDRPPNWVLDPNTPEPVAKAGYQEWLTRKQKKLNFSRKKEEQ